MFTQLTEQLIGKDNKFTNISMTEIMRTAENRDAWRLIITSWKVDRIIARWIESNKLTLTKYYYITLFIVVLD